MLLPDDLVGRQLVEGDVSEPTDLHYKGPVDGDGNVMLQEYEGTVQ